ncbi:amidohydrolase family protein [Candidatus Amarolinea dominans]|uniref:amidohydrolase family protein n=1 Tax=Candidatus Amarolinea dominans TaxID=3140696 RepID=UPI0031CC7986
MLSGCTTSSDHHYLWPHGSRIDDEIEAAGELGIRFHASRGSMSLGESQGGLPPDSVVEDEDAILADCRRAIETFHQRERFGMVRIVVAPAHPFSVTPDLMRRAPRWRAATASGCTRIWPRRRMKREFCLARFGRRPVAYAEDLGWTGRDVWHAHCVHLSEAEIDLFVRTGTGAAHCPSSNMRLGSGIAPIRRLLDRGASVGLGVDGSASNDGAHLLGEARQAMLLQRVLGNPAALTAQEALELATLGGAAVLGRDDIGALARHGRGLHRPEPESPGLQRRPARSPGRRPLRAAAGGHQRHQRPCARPRGPDRGPGRGRPGGATQRRQSEAGEGRVESGDWRSEIGDR